MYTHLNKITYFLGKFMLKVKNDDLVSLLLSLNRYLDKEKFIVFATRLT